jgi:hypothetical protein
MMQREYAQSIESLENRLHQQRSVSNFLDRVEAQLIGLTNTLETVLADMLRLQAVGIEQIRFERTKLVDMLRQEANELNELNSGEMLIR